MSSPSRRFSSPRAKRQRAGFTLVEVLVSLAVLAVCLSAIGQVMSASLRTVGAIETHLSLTETARAIWTALPERGALNAGRSGRTIGEHRWRLEVQPLVSNLIDPRVPAPWTPQRVTLAVRSPDGAMVQIDSIRLRRGAAP